MRVRVVISGRVQGVGFRYATVRQARRLGLTGWVRNTRDGRVEIVADGPKEAITELLDWAVMGPDGAEVTGLQRTDLEPGEPFQSFDIR